MLTVWVMVQKLENIDIRLQFKSNFTLAVPNLLWNFLFVTQRTDFSINSSLLFY